MSQIYPHDIDQSMAAEKIEPTFFSPHLERPFKIHAIGNHTRKTRRKVQHKLNGRIN